MVLLALDGVAAAANSADEVCRRWVCDRADMSEGVSTGNVTSCDPGDLLPPGRPNALKLVNLYRFLTGMPAVTEDPTFDTDAQDCAIIQAANGLSHTPTTTDTCYNATGATASDRSSICGGQAVGCIDLYMDDSANATGPNFGHRTWILANSLGPVGVRLGRERRPDDDRLLLLSGRRDGKGGRRLRRAGRRRGRFRCRRSRPPSSTSQAGACRATRSTSARRRRR